MKVDHEEAAPRSGSGKTVEVADATEGFALPLVATDSDCYPNIVIHDAKWRRTAVFPKTADGAVRATRLVNAVNAHSALVAALHNVSERKMPDGSDCWCIESFEEGDDPDDHSDYCTAARAALSLARGELNSSAKQATSSDGE